MKDSSTRHRN